MKKINVKTVGTTKIDKQIYKLYKGFNFSENYDFWNKYIFSLRVQFTNNGNLFEKNWEFLDIYSKMILNIIDDCQRANPDADNFQSHIKYQWCSTSFQFERYFKYVVSIVKDDMKCIVLKEILNSKNTIEFEKYINARLFFLGAEKIFDHILYTDDKYVEFFASKNLDWEKKNLGIVKFINNRDEIEEKIIQSLLY